MTEPTTRFDEAYAAFLSGEKSNAVDIWGALADEGNASAAWILGAVHLNGLISDDGTPDFKTAACFFRQAAERGHCSAQSTLGHLLLFGYGIEKDEAEARSWFRLAAEKGDDEAQCGLAYIYDTGSGGAEDFDASFTLYSHAAEHGNPEAQYRLGLAHLAGRGTPQNAVQGLFWLVRATELGHATARVQRDELLPYIDDDIAKRVFELTLERSPALH